MTWDIETSCGHEVRKIRDRVVPYLMGTILDFGCGDEKICHQAIGIDLHGKAADLKLDLSEPEGYKFFGDCSADVVFSSHFLEDLYDYKGAVLEFFRIAKFGGHIILYLPHKDHYPHVGEEGANVNHKHDFCPEEILSALSSVYFEVCQNEVRTDGNEYSFLLVLKKLSVPARFIERRPSAKNGKTAVVVRYGGFGDLVMVSPVFRLLKEAGYRTIANCTPHSKFVFDHNPNVDEFLIQGKGVVPSSQLKE